MAYTIDKVFFERLAAEIVDMYNICKNTDLYMISHVEVTCVLVDYQDGNGNRIVSRAMLRHPVENVYEMITDVLGSPEEALKLLLRTVKDQAEKNFDLKYKVKISKYN